MNPDYEELKHQLDTLRGHQLQRLAERDPSLTLLSEALVRERMIHQMDEPALLAFVLTLEAQWD